MRRRGGGTKCRTRDRVGGSHQRRNALGAAARVAGTIRAREASRLWSTSPTSLSPRDKSHASSRRCRMVWSALRRNIRMKGIAYPLLSSLHASLTMTEYAYQNRSDGVQDCRSFGLHRSTKQKNKPELLHVHFHAVLNAKKNENKCPISSISCAGWQPYRRYKPKSKYLLGYISRNQKFKKSRRRHNAQVREFNKMFNVSLNRWIDSFE